MDWNKLLNEKRFKPTTRKQTDYDLRNEFESDFGRIIFSPAVRRMHDKTQVFPLTTDDNIHTRLTHSMEVQSIAYSLGLNICSKKEFINRINKEKEELIRVIPIILSSIALCHDIGNPPFGHYGEDIIADYFSKFFCKGNDIKTNLSEYQKDDFIKYNGNAQGFRVLTRLQVLQDVHGLNLTFGTLCAYLKYPFLSNELEKEGF